MQKIILGKSKFFLALILIILIRLVLLKVDSFHIDMTAWQAWAARLIELGPGNFYSDKVWTNYTPGYLLILWLLGSLNNFLFHFSFYSLNFAILIKLTNTFFDLGSAFLIYKIINKNSNQKWALVGFLFYISNIASIFNTSVWGQIDGVLTFFLLSSVWFLLEKRNLAYSLISITFSYLLKPQTIAILPIFILSIYQGFSYKKIIYSLPLSLGLLVVINFLFFPNNLFFGLISLSIQMTKDYPYTSLFAFNFWSLIGWWQSDQKTFLNLSFYMWGFFIYLISLILIFFFTIRKKLFKEKANIYLGISLSLMAFYLFPTRIHERYLFPFFAFFLITAILKKSKKLIIIYFILSAIHFLNLYYVYIYYNVIFKSPNATVSPLYNFIDSTHLIFAILTIISFGFILYLNYREKNQIIPGFKNLKINYQILTSKMQNKLFSFKILKNPNFWLGLILVFALFSRGFRIWYPNKYVFDEVYHAFTAKEYLNGSKAAWEWWTTPPPGVAFEWTHPPLAKEVMTSFMYTLRSTDAWAYRLPGVITGVIAVYLLYRLVLTLFKNQQTALFSAFIFSIDGLNFVQSRTGMNDIYLIAFSLGALLFFFNKKFFWSAIFVGLALASKWTGIYLLGFIFLIKTIQELKTNKLALTLNIFLSTLVLSGLTFPLIIASRSTQLPSLLQSASNYYAPIQTVTLTVLVLFYLIYPRFRSWGIFILLSVLIYIATYIPFFLLGHDYKTFIGLQQQMWWYHTGLKAHHDYSSPWWSWPLNLYPVWYFVDYYKNSTIANIFASGNPGVFWVGTIALILTIKELITNQFKNKFSGSKGLLISLLGFFIFWLPWALSPRIMFLYHFSPSVPFLSTILGYQLNSLWEKKEQRFWVIIILVYLFLSFLLVFPMLTGIALPRKLMLLFFTTNLTKNPFGS